MLLMTASLFVLDSVSSSLDKIEKSDWLLPYAMPQHGDASSRLERQF